MKNKKNSHQIRLSLTGKVLKKLKLRNAVIKCENCNKYVYLHEIECHHSVISISELSNEVQKGTLNITDARQLARDRENIMMVCHECHEQLHNRN